MDVSFLVSDKIVAPKSTTRQNILLLPVLAKMGFTGFWLEDLKVSGNRNLQTFKPSNLFYLCPLFRQKIFNQIKISQI
ncbi:MAG: hypothetical protein DYG98_09815 [Haliscomenobacteraceae bacterium CHB4]|nr:hypothetical protein [Haliscomenobacteraceae bacterium CHB4]